MDEKMTLENMTIKEIDPVAELNRLTLELRKAETYIKELEEKIVQNENSLDGELTYQGWVNKCQLAELRVRELKKGIGKVLRWRNLDGDGISDPLREELYELNGLRARVRRETIRRILWKERQ